MENKINIAEILKDCPMGTLLYSPICGECRLVKVYDYLGVDVINGTDDVFNFSYDGRYNLMGECCIFPSEDNRDWSTFQRPFKDGDIVYSHDNRFPYISIYQSDRENNLFHYHASMTLTTIAISKPRSVKINDNTDKRNLRFATEKEERMLFYALEAHGYKWNAETKTLEKLIEPKFKAGDTIQNKETYKRRTITKIHQDCYECDNRYVLTFENQDNWELVELKFKVGDRIKPISSSRSGIIVEIDDKGYYVDYSKGSGIVYVSFIFEKDYELAINKFDISTLKPFDKVLCRMDNEDIWGISLFERYAPTNPYPFFCIQDSFFQCIPYEQNKHLLGTTDDCDEYYKTWNYDKISKKSFGNV